MSNTAVESVDELNLDQYRRPYGRADPSAGEAIRVLSHQKVAIPPFMVHLMGLQNADACSIDRRSDGYEIVVGPSGHFDEERHFVETRGYHVSLHLDDASFVTKRDEESEGADVLLSLADDDDVSVVHITPATEADQARIDAAMEDRYPYRSGTSNRKRFEERVGIDTSDVLGDQAFTKMAFTNEWFYVKRSIVDFRGSSSSMKKLSVPKPLLLLSHFAVDDVVGLEIAPEEDMAMLVPSGSGQMTVKFTRHQGRGNVRLQLPDGLPFGPEVWMTYDAERDTIVIGASLAAFGVDENSVRGLSKVAN